MEKSIETPFWIGTFGGLVLMGGEGNENFKCVWLIEKAQHISHLERGEGDPFYFCIML